MCHLFKPDRTHHCSVCNRCVLNMDYQCPWIHNCIGFYNRKVFILILVYACKVCMR
jgi:palmitoyltransferase ZDHHC2/15/20